MRHANGLKASERVLAGARIRAEAVRDPMTAGRDVVYAELHEADARSKDLPDTVQRDAGGELIDVNTPLAPCDPDPKAHGRHALAVSLINTVADPDRVAAEASLERLELAQDAGVLDLALDALDTIQPQDSLERMLVEQMSVMHRATMRAAYRLEVEQRNGVISGAERDASSVRAVRYAGIIARCSAGFQQGLLVFLRKRTGGVQRVQVQYNTVADGGQAVIGNNVDARPRGRGPRKPRGEGSQNGT